MSNLKLFNIFLFFCINFIIFNVFAMSFSELEDSVNKKFSFRRVSNYCYETEVFGSKSLVHGILKETKDIKVNKYMRFYSYFISINCIYASDLQYQLKNFMQFFPTVYRYELIEIMDSIFYSKYDMSIKVLNKIQLFITQANNFLLFYLMEHVGSRDYDTSLIQTMLLLTLKIRYLLNTDHKELLWDDEVVHSIVEVMNLIQNFRTANCGEFPSILRHKYKDIYSLYETNDFFGIPVKSHANKNNIKNLIYTNNQLYLYNDTYCSPADITLEHVISTQQKGDALSEILNAKIKMKSEQKTIIQIYNQVNKNHIYDLKLLLWYQQSILNVIIKLLYTKVTGLLLSYQDDRENLISMIPKFIDLPTEFTDIFKYEDEEKDSSYIENMKKLNENSFSEIVIDKDSKSSTFEEFTEFLKSKEQSLKCFFSVLKFLKREHSQFNFPRDPLNIEQILDFEDEPKSKLVKLYDDDDIMHNACQFIHDLYNLCLEGAFFSGYMHGNGYYIGDRLYSILNDILDTIKTWSVKVLKKCTKKVCGDLLKVLYDINITIVSKRNDEIHTNLMPIIPMIMSILNMYDNDHCNPKKFDFFISSKIDFNAIGKGIPDKVTFDVFIESKTSDKVSQIMANNIEILDIVIFYNKYVEHTNLLISEDKKPNFFWKGEMKSIDDIYKTITSMAIATKHVYEFYNVYFKLSLSLIFQQIYALHSNLFETENSKSNKFLQDACKYFKTDYGQSLTNAYFPNYLSVLFTHVNKYLQLVLNLCSGGKKKPKILTKKKEEVQTQFETFGVFVVLKNTMTSDEETSSISSRLSSYVKYPFTSGKTIKYEMITNDKALGFMNLNKEVNTILTDLWNLDVPE